MTRRRLDLALSLAFGALLLLLDDKTGHDLFLNQLHTLAAALLARFDMTWVIGAAAATVRANCVAHVWHFHVFAVIEVFQ